MKDRRTPKAGLVAANPAEELTAAEKRTVAEVVRLVLEHQDEIEDRIGAIGRVVLEKCFDDDPAAVFDRRRPRTFEALLALAGDRRFRIDRRLLSVAVRIAAWDRLIDADVWREFDPGRKEELLPLGDPEVLEVGAREAMTNELSRAQVAQWVEAWRAEHGDRPRRRRRLRAFTGRVERLAAVLDARSLEDFHEDFDGLDAAERRTTLRKLERLQERIGRLRTRLVSRS